ncbi:uncharacterized protein rbbp8l isoform X2 [Genypterus blacodes]|uniref:uncharacterized protein rbbp8l isoform X2 n=1 Tax=Genypterus blacodes TaxID=154954 RepID=UPI003F764764
MSLIPVSRSKVIVGTMESFNELLHKLRDAHERELEGWQVRVQELSNKKGCDTKRMEELFTRNQQMKEQQRLLTENIKTLENRLRAGLCDRCTVTQEVAKRRQQEYEALQMQSLQHVSILVGELNNLKKENKRMKEEVRSLRAALEGHSEHSSTSTPIEVKGNSSPDLSPSAGPLALASAPASRASNQPADDDVAMKTEPSQRSEESLSDRRHTRGWNRSHFESYKSPPTSGPWKTEHSVVRGRTQSVDGHVQRVSLHSQPLLPKTISHSSSTSTSSSSHSVEGNPSRHVLHAPVPCRPQPIKSTAAAFPWSLSEAPDWVTLPGTPNPNLVLQPDPKLNLSRFPNLIPTNQQANHCSSRRQAFGQSWPRKSPPQPSTKEPTVVFRVSGLTEQAESQPMVQEKKETPPPTKSERVFGEGLKDAYDGPLDLSDRGRSKPSETQRNDMSLAQDGARAEERSPDRKKDPSAHIPESSPSPLVIPSSSSTSPANQREEESPSDHNYKEFNKDWKQKEEVNGKTEQTNEKKVPVLTISLRPVVVLETLNSTLQKEESLSSNSKSSSPADEPEGSSEEPEEQGSVTGQENIQGFKRKRASVESDTDRESDTDNIQQERKIKISLISEEQSAS